MIKVGRDICTDLDAAASREWLETNGIGGYASGTVSTANTRRYHAVLVAATRAPLGRMVLVAKLEETLIVDGIAYELSANQYPGKIHPTGYEWLTDFRLDPFPIWTYEVGGLGIEKRVFMPHGENTTLMTWSVVNGEAKDVRLDVRPLVAFRDHHHLRHERTGFNASYMHEDRCLSLDDGGEVKLHLSHSQGLAVDGGDWYRDLEYRIEQERGFDFTEDLYQPCTFSFQLDQPATIIASTTRVGTAAAAELEAMEIDRRSAIAARCADDLSRHLSLAADQFIVDRGSGKTVIAGYHWFSDWGRDTMIALPGLTLSTGRSDVAKSIIAEFAKHISDGMIPNRFPDEGETPDYNTVDAALWFFEALRAYLAASGDEEFVRDELYAKLVDIIDWHERGTRFGIKVDTDGLLRAGEPGVQITWMDAKIGDRVITPRTGKPVEIQALWFNALRTMCDLAKRFGNASHEKRFAKMAAAARKSFNLQFWYFEGGYLFDVIDGEGKDASLRPNQIFAVSLHHSMLDRERSRKVVETVERELLTPVGLRSLAPGDPSYVGEYIGSPEKRDSSYHQGTVWAWLIGPFIEAYRKVNSKDPEAETRVNEIISGFEGHLNEATLGQVSEIFDGDPPHFPRGAAAQAWSVGELLRVIRK